MTRGNSAATACGWALLVTLWLALMVAAATATARSVADEIPRSYAGNFKWDDSPELQSVAIGFRAVEAVGGDVVRAEGCGVYNSGGRITTIRVKMIVRLPSLSLTIWELDPIDARGFVADGRHEGHLSGDLQVLDAVWTTRDTGEQGRLRLHAVAGVECEPLQQSQGKSGAATMAMVALRRAASAAKDQRRPSP